MTLSKAVRLGAAPAVAAGLAIVVAVAPLSAGARERPSPTRLFLPSPGARRTKRSQPRLESLAEFGVSTQRTESSSRSRRKKAKKISSP